MKTLPPYRSVKTLPPAAASTVPPPPAKRVFIAAWHAGSPPHRFHCFWSSATVVAPPSPTVPRIATHATPLSAQRLGLQSTSSALTSTVSVTTPAAAARLST